MGAGLLPVSIGSVVSTFLVSLAVVGVAVWVLRIALGDPDQPATERPPTRRGWRRSDPTGGPDDAGPTTPSEEAESVAASPGSAEAPPARPGRARRQREWRRTRAAGAWLRLRSALTLVILVTFVGVLLAVAVGGALTLAARALREAVG